LTLINVQNYKVLLFSNFITVLPKLCDLIVWKKSLYLGKILPTCSTGQADIEIVAIHSMGD